MSDTITLEVGGMTCDGCSSRVRDALQSVSGVSSAERVVNLTGEMGAFGDSPHTILSGA